MVFNGTINGDSLPDYLIETERQRGLWGESGQSRIAASTVAIGGLGGIGAFSAMMLAKSGVGALRVCDRDSYEIANIVEQAFATHDTAQRNKVDVALQEMRRHNRFGELTGFTGDLSFDADCEQLVAGADLVVSGVDNPVARIALGRAAERHGIPMVVSANIGWSIVHSVYLPGEFNYGAVWREVPGLRYAGGFPDMNDPKTVKLVQREWDIWVVTVSGYLPEALAQFLSSEQSYYWYAAPPASFAASLGAIDALKILVGQGDSCIIYPQLFLYDMQTHQQWKWAELRRRRDALHKAWERGDEAVRRVVERWVHLGR